MLPHVVATRYVTPLREGGSLPGLMEADDLGTYVVKFHGAGQGRKALIAEVICGVLAQSVGIPVPDLVTVDLDPALAAGEPDQEVQDLLRASAGLNLGVDFLPGALDFDPAAFDVEPGLAGRVLWFDAWTGNVDRSWRNPNLLFWHRATWLIDHGAALTFHHRWSGAGSFAAKPFEAATHALIGFGPDVASADSSLAPLVTDELVRAAVAQVPELWLSDEPGFDSVDAVRLAYVEQLLGRLHARDSWLPGVVAEAAAGHPRVRVETPDRPSRRPEWVR